MICKLSLGDKGTNQLIVKNATPWIYMRTFLYRLPGGCSSDYKRDLVSLIYPVIGKLSLVAQQNISKRLSISTEPITKFQSLQITVFEMLNALYVISMSRMRMPAKFMPVNIDCTATVDNRICVYTIFMAGNNVRDDNLKLRFYSGGRKQKFCLYYRHRSKRICALSLNCTTDYFNEVKRFGQICF
jgi:hypothetical protein